MSLDVVQPNRIDVSAKTKVWDFTAATLRCDTPLVATDAVNKDYADSVAGAASWGSITGVLAAQADLSAALGGKYSTTNPDGYISDISGFTTTDLVEGANLYYTDARAIAGVTGMGVAAFTNNAGYITDLSGFTTTDLAEGTNLYFTNDRATSALHGQNISLFVNDVGYLTAITGAALLLDQTTPQTLINGVPLMTTAVNPYGSGDQLLNLDYIREGEWLMPPIIDWYDPVAEEGLPVAPTVGDRYGADSTGFGWTIDYVYEWDGSTWVEYPPEEGWLIWDLFGLILWAFFSGGWMEVGEYSWLRLDGSNANSNIDIAGYDLITTGAVGRDPDNEINWGVDNSLAIVIGGATHNIVSISDGVADNDKLVTQGYVDDAITAENLWDRTGTVLSPHAAGDSITLNSDTYRYGVGNVSLYVDSSTGSDSNDGAIATPFLTINKAINEAVKLKTYSSVSIRLRAGTYEMTAPISCTALATKLTIYSTESAVLQYTAGSAGITMLKFVDCPYEIQMYGFTLNCKSRGIDANNSYVALGGLTLNGYTQYGVWLHNGARVYGYSGSTITLNSSTGAGTYDLYIDNASGTFDGNVDMVNGYRGGWIVNKSNIYFSGSVDFDSRVASSLCGLYVSDSTVTCYGTSAFDGKGVCPYGIYAINNSTLNYLLYARAHSFTGFVQDDIYLGGGCNLFNPVAGTWTYSGGGVNSVRASQGAYICSPDELDTTIVWEDLTASDYVGYDDRYIQVGAGVAWDEITGTQTDISLSGFTNDLGNYGGFLTSVAFADLTDYPANATGSLTNDGSGNFSWVDYSGVVSFPGFSSLFTDYAFTDNSATWDALVSFPGFDTLFNDYGFTDNSATWDALVSFPGFDTLFNDYGFTDNSATWDALVTFPGFSDLSTDYGFTDNSSNWDTAYGWGDWSGQGFITGVAWADITGTQTDVNLSGFTDDIGLTTAVSAQATFVDNEVVVAKGTGRNSDNGGANGLTLLGQSAVPSTPSSEQARIYNYQDGTGIDSYTKIMLHMEGANGGTVFNDSCFLKAPDLTSLRRADFARSGNANTSTAQYKFGTSSAAFDGTGDFLYGGDYDDYDLRTGEWTFDMWVRFNAVNTNQTIFCKGSDSNNRHHFVFFGAGGVNTLNNYIRISSTVYASVTCAFAPSVDTWYHLETSRIADDIVIFINGVRQVTTAVSIRDIVALTGGMYLGKTPWSGTERYFNGYIDEFRFTNGKYRNSDDFTPPTAPYDGLNYSVISEAGDTFLLAGGTK